MPQHREFDPGLNFPDVVMDALQEFVGALNNFAVRIKPGQANTLQVPAGAGGDQVALSIAGKWRFISAPAEQAGSGAARTVDVYACTGPNAYAPSSPGEIDTTDYAFVLRIVDAGASAPAGFAHTRRVAQAVWTGSAFSEVTPVLGGQPVKLGSGALLDGVMTAAKVAAAAVTTPKLADEAVTEPKIGTSAVSAPKIQSGSIEERHLDDGLREQFLRVEIGGTFRVGFGLATSPNFGGGNVRTGSFGHGFTQAPIAVAILPRQSTSAGVRTIVANYTSVDAFNVNYLLQTADNVAINEQIQFFWMVIVPMPT